MYNLMCLRPQVICTFNLSKQTVEKAPQWVPEELVRLKTVKFMPVLEVS